MGRAPLDASALHSPNEGLHDPSERRAAGRLMGLLWMMGGISGALWYLVPGAEMGHWHLGLVSASFSTSGGIGCVLAPLEAVAAGADLRRSRAVAPRHPDRDGDQRRRGL